MQQELTIFCGGVRGTETLCGAEYAEFGGATTALGIQSSAGDVLLVDLGSGAKNLQGLLPKKTGSTVRVLLTHYHLDHLIGVLRFSPLYDPAVPVECMGPTLDSFDCAQALHRIMASPFWPVPVSSLGTSNQFLSLPDDPVEWGGFRLRHVLLHHFEGCVAYRIQALSGGPSVVIASDVEWGQSTDAEKEALRRLCRDPEPAKLLLFDGHIAPDQQTRYTGWGHSTWEEGLELCRETGVEELRIIHHAPYHSDPTLRALERAMQKSMPSASFARQGETIRL